MEKSPRTAVVFGKNFTESFTEHLQTILDKLSGYDFRVYIYKPFYQFMKSVNMSDSGNVLLFSSTRDLPDKAEFMLSIGGDGTFLEAVTYVRDKGIPVAGINAGRLGFLADIAQEEISLALDQIIAGSFNLEERTLLELTSGSDLFGEFNFALNEVTVHKRDDSSMIQLHASLDGEYLNTYWADGLIVSTPTGSTAYSLSVGGPLVVPGSSDLIIAPIAPHNLTVRPIVYPDEMELTLRMEGRSGKVLVSLDSRSVVVEAGLELTIRKAPFKVVTLRLKDHSFYYTLRNKLMWGADKRN